MRKLSFAVKALAALAGVVLLLLGWRLLEQYLPPHIVEQLGLDATRLWTRPYFQLGELQVTPSFLLKALLFLAVVALIASRSSLALRRILLDRSSLDEGQKFAIQRTATYSVLLAGTLIGLDSVGVHLSSLTVLGGALGVGIGFGLQSIMTNFVSGLILLVERPVKVGDRVDVAGLDGTVLKIGARATWVRTNDNIVIILPNSEFIVKPVVNWTATSRQVRFKLPVSVSYRSDPEQVRNVLTEVASRNPDVLKEPKPDVMFRHFGDSGMEFDLRVWTSTRIEAHADLKSDLYFAIFAAFREHAIEIPYPQRELHIRSGIVPPAS